MIECQQPCARCRKKREDHGRPRAARIPGYSINQKDGAAEKCESQEPRSVELCWILVVVFQTENTADRLGGLHHQSLVDVNVERWFQVSATRKKIGLHPAESHVVEVPAFNPSPVDPDEREGNGKEKCGAESPISGNPGNKIVKR